MFEITKQTIVANDGNFEEHPESYRPRVFVEAGVVMAVYELLTNGQAIVWPSFPDKETCGFDYWRMYAPQPGGINMVRQQTTKQTTEDEGKTFNPLTYPIDLQGVVSITNTGIAAMGIVATTDVVWPSQATSEAVPQADGYSESGDETCPATTQGPGFCTCDQTT